MFFPLEFIKLKPKVIVVQNYGKMAIILCFLVKLQNYLDNWLLQLVSDNEMLQSYLVDHEAQASPLALNTVGPDYDTQNLRRLQTPSDHKLC